MLKILIAYFVFEKRSLMSSKTFANNIEIRQTLLTRYLPFLLKKDHFLYLDWLIIREFYIILRMIWPNVSS